MRYHVSRPKPPQWKVERYLLRLPPELHAQLKEAAIRDGRSLHGQIIRILSAWLEKRENGA